MRKILLSAIGLSPEGEVLSLAPIDKGQAQERSARSWRFYFQIALVVVIFAFSFSLLLFRDEVTALRDYGYPGVFFLSLLASATIIVPVPGPVAVFTGGMFLSPALVALVAASGATLGELTGYTAGLAGNRAIRRLHIYRTLERRVRKAGFFTIFILAATPNPVFDIAGIAAGVLRFPLWAFLLACWLGKIIKYMAIAYMGAWGGNWLLDMTRHSWFWGIIALLLLAIMGVAILRMQDLKPVRERIKATALRVWRGLPARVPRP